MHNNRTKIIATIGPATSSKEMLRTLIEAGMNVCRLNFSHGSHDDHQSVVNHINELNDELNTSVALLADLGGPKIRIGEIEGGSTEIINGSEFVLTTEKGIGNATQAWLTYESFPSEVKPGERVLIDDGKLVLEVIATDGKKEVRTRVIHGGILSSKKGVNLPNTKVSIPCLTAKDHADLDFALANKVQWVALSFVRSASDIIELKHLILEKSGQAKVIAKIEKPEAVRVILEILRETDAVMVARGDLGVELPMQEVPLIQKNLVKLCLEHAKPVIVATQMMESMITSVSPTRAEVNDVANAVMDGADAVMLSGETSVGQFPKQVVENMRKIIEHVESYEGIYHVDHQLDPSKERYISDAICDNACSLAKRVNASAIVTMTFSGYTAFKISSYRPRAGVYVFTSNRRLLKMLSLIWGVTGVYYDKFVSTDHTIADIKFILRKKGFVKEKDMVINIASMPITDKGQSNMLKLSMV